MREAVAGLYSPRDQSRGDAVGVGVEIGVRAHLVRRGAAVEAEMLEGDDVEIRLLLGTDLDEIREDQFVTLTHGFMDQANGKPGTENRE